jgi:hypothetical protein
MVERVDLIGVTIELYRLVPGDFVAARNARAKEAAAAGDRALAAEIRALPKPSAAAWALNEFTRESPKLVKEFASLGGKLRSAQRNADREQLNYLVEQRKALLRRASSTIQRSAADSAVRLSASALTEVEQSLRAATADEDGEAAVFSGRLVRSVQSDGLEPVDLDEAVAGPPLPQAVSMRDSPSKGASTRARTAKTKDEKARSHSALVTRTRRAAEAADAALDALRGEETSLERERDALDAEALTLQEQFDRLEERRTELDDHATKLARDIRKALDASHDAHISAERAAKDR